MQPGNPFSGPRDTSATDPIYPAMADLVGHILVIIPKAARLDMPRNTPSSNGATTQDVVVADIACLSAAFSTRTTQDKGIIQLPATIQVGQVMTDYWIYSLKVMGGLCASYNGWRKPTPDFYPIVLARVARGAAKPGQTRPYVLEDVSNEPGVMDAAMAWYQQYQAMKARQEAEAALAAVSAPNPQLNGAPAANPALAWGPQQGIGGAASAPAQPAAVPAPAQQPVTVGGTTFTPVQQAPAQPAPTPAVAAVPQVAWTPTGGDTGGMKPADF